MPRNAPEGHPIQGIRLALIVFLAEEMGALPKFVEELR